ncbi:MAG: hypothetical protein K6D02_09880 [Lachnospiraceae bacterium]|nr:hypothetical protein [Lachnospiraceae bacterium]
MDNNEFNENQFNGVQLNGSQAYGNQVNGTQANEGRSVMMAAVYAFILNVVSWFIFTLFDAYIESTGTGQHTEMYFGLVQILIIMIIYTVARAKGLWRNEHFGIKLLQKLIWIGACAGFSMIAFYMIGSDTMIVKQNGGGFEHFLNGIEYGIFAIFFPVINVIWFLIIDFIELIILKNKNK